ncbi:MAG: patatin-like phospholipase family protein [Sulfurovaceae bacterium]|nr:patatin-like phospholipase family protein [Sulfurovaceae bacterium]
MSEISLALSGGAARGAYHLGVLQYIDDMNIKIKYICGTSIGAVIGTSYAAGVSPRRQLEIFKSKEFREAISFNFFRKSIFRINSKAAIFNELLPIDNLEELNIPVFFTAVDLISGKELYYSSGKVPEICMAFSALIPLFPPVKYNELLLGDGGIINHMPINPLQEHPYPIVGVNLHPLTISHNQNNIFDFLKSSIYLKTYSNSGDSQNKCDVFITNDKLRDYSLFSFKHFDELFDMGYLDAADSLDIYATMPD